MPAPPMLIIIGVMPLRGMPSWWAYSPSHTTQQEKASPAMASMMARIQGGRWRLCMSSRPSSMRSRGSSAGIHTRTSRARASSIGTQVDSEAAQLRCPAWGGSTAPARMAASGMPAWTISIIQGRESASLCATAARRLAGWAKARATPPRAIPTQAAPSVGMAAVSIRLAAVIRKVSTRTWRGPLRCT